jgi:hypothetical protein
VANTIKTAGVTLGGSKATLIGCTAGTQVAITDLVLFNTTGSAQTVFLFLYTASNATETPLYAGYSVAANALHRLSGKFFLQPGDEIRGYGGASGTITGSIAYSIVSGAAPIAKGFTGQGAYAAGTTYAINDIVSSGGLPYLSRTDGNIGNTPETSPGAWMLLLAATSISYATAADVWAGTATSKVVTPKVLADAQAFQSLTDAATIAVDFNLGINFKVTLAGNRTLGAPANIRDGQSGIIRIRQDGTGSRGLTFNTAWKFVGGAPPTLSTAANTIDRFSYSVVMDTETSTLRVECTVLEKNIA